MLLFLHLAINLFLSATYRNSLGFFLIKSACSEPLPIVVSARNNAAFWKGKLLKSL